MRCHQKLLPIKGNKSKSIIDYLLTFIHEKKVSILKDANTIGFASLNFLTTYNDEQYLYSIESIGVDKKCLK